MDYSYEYSYPKLINQLYNPLHGKVPILMEFFVADVFLLNVTRGSVGNSISMGTQRPLHHIPLVDLVELEVREMLKDCGPKFQFLVDVLVLVSEATEKALRMGILKTGEV